MDAGGVVAGWMRRARTLLAHPRAAWGMAALAVLLLIPALGNGLILDDYYHRQVALHGEGYLGEVRHPLDMFRFFPAELREAGLTSGLWPWWTSPVSIGFFRPLAAVSHWLDYTLWPQAIWLAHLQSLLWLGGLVVVAGALYRRTLEPAWVAGLATLMFALDGGHALPASWLASRNMLMAGLFGALSILWHVRGAGGWTLGRWLSPLALAAALLSAEIGIGALGYLLAYALLRTPGSWLRRAATMAPHLLVVVIWQLVYGWLGYEARHAGLYTHPLYAPWQFLVAVTERAPVLITSQLTLPFADAWLLTPVAWTIAIAVGALVLLAALVWLLWPQLRAEPSQRWYALGALLSAVPACTTFPNGRMLLFVGLGGAPLLARLVQRASASTSRGLRLLTGALLARHTLLAALSLPLLAISPRTVRGLFELSERTLPSDEGIEAQTLVVVRTPHTFLSGFALMWRRLEPTLGRDAPARIRTASATVDRLRITRVDERTLEIQADGGLLGSRLSQVEWDPVSPRSVGHHVDVGDMTVDVIAATEDGRPVTFRVRFDVALEDEGLRWVAWQGRGFSAFAPPSIGESVVLEPIDMLDVMTHVD